MRNLGFGPRAVISLGIVLAGLGGAARGQDGSEEVPPWVQRQAADPSSLAMKRYAAQQRTRKEMEKQLKKIRFEYFRKGDNKALRQQGIAKIREFTDPAIFPAMIEILATEDKEVRLALLDHFRDRQSDEGDGALGWVAVFDKDKAIRDGATERLRSRVKKEGRPSDSLKLVVFEGLRHGTEESMTNSARLADTLSILEAIPWLIEGQVTQAPQGTAAGANVGGGGGALAWIMVGTQVAFISGLTPVVGPSAVAFDPQLSVVNEGTVLRVLDASVITYHVDINAALIDLTSREYGESTRQLGWNLPGWRDWYKTRFIPFEKAKQEEAARRAEEARRIAEAQKEPQKK